MRKYILFVLLLVAVACKVKVSAPLAVPTSAESVLLNIKGKAYQTTNVGVYSMFKDDTTPEWLTDMPDTSTFHKDYIKERMQFTLHFVNDTLVKIGDNNKMHDANYVVDTTSGEKEPAGVKIRISYPDTDGTMGFPGMTTPMMLTYTYIVRGMDDHQLQLQTNREYNRRRVVVLMEADKK